MLKLEPEDPPIFLTHVTTLQEEDHAMTEVIRQTGPSTPVSGSLAATGGSPAPDGPISPGGTAELAGRPVARIGFGVMQLERSALDKDAALAVLRQAVSAGVNHLDTAQFYGSCNDLIREALAPYDDDLALVSKVGAVRNPAAKPIPLILAQRPAELRAQVEANLTSLGTNQLRVVNLRRADAPPGIIAQGEQRVDLDDQLAELTALRDAGKIGGIGLSNVSADQLRQALPAGIACVQNSYSVLDRAAEPVLDLCREHGIAWVPFFPLGSAGFGNMPKVTDNPTVIAIAAELGVTPAQVGLAWQLVHYGKTLLIPGTANPAHLAENLAAGGVELPKASRAALDQLSAATTEDAYARPGITRRP
jgi:pyridoxine 4-dehydrogenase